MIVTMEVEKNEKKKNFKEGIYLYFCSNDHAILLRLITVKNWHHSPCNSYKFCMNLYSLFLLIYSN